LRTACSRGAKKVDHEDAKIIREAVQPLTGSAQDYDSLLALIGDARSPIVGGNLGEGGSIAMDGALAFWQLKGRKAGDSLVGVENARNLLSTMPIRTYTELRNQIREAMRRQHPEWIDANGKSPLCDSYEAPSRQIARLIHAASNGWPGGGLGSVPNISAGGI
jgi:hypothetical protein